MIIFLELFILYLIGFIIGNILGNIFTDKVYYRFMEIFLNSNISIVDFQVNLDVVKLGFTLMGILLIIVTFIIVKKIYKLNEDLVLGVFSVVKPLPIFFDYSIK